MGWERVRQEMRKKLKTTPPPFPPFWHPENVGDELFGEIINIRPSPFEADINLYDVKDPETNEVWTTPSNVVLVRTLQELNPQVGDFILIKYTGKRKRTKLFEVSVLPKAEAEKHLVEMPSPEVVPEKMKPPTISEEKLEEIKKFLAELRLLHQKIKFSLFDHYLNRVKRFDVDPRHVITIFNLRLFTQDGEEWVELG